MATLEKLVKSVEALKLHQTPSVSLDETMTKKDKISHCVSVTEAICSQGSKNSSESAKYLAMAMEMFFTLLDDADADIRMVADENLNKMTRSLGESNIGRLQVELYKEIKKNGSQRCVRAAMTRFSQLAKHIRPSKCRAYLVNLLPCLESLALRPEEQIHECLAQSFPSLFSVLGPHTNNNEVRLLLKSFLANIGTSNAVIRRSTGTILTILATQCRQPPVYIAWLLTTVIHLILPLNTNTSPHLVLGVLTVCRNIVPGVTRDADQDTVETLVLLYQLCVHLTRDTDHNIVTTSLETLQHVLRSAPSMLVYMLTSEQGLGVSRLSWDQDQAGTMVDSVVSVTRPAANMDTSDNEADSEGDTEHRDTIVIPSVKQDNIPSEIEEKEVALVSLAKHLSKFLLSDMKNELVDDRTVRVSVKTLSVSVLCQVVSHCPQVWTLNLDCGVTMDAMTSVEMSDMLLYLDHTDPALRGGVARLLWTVIRGAAVQSGGRLEHWFQQCIRPLDELVSLLAEVFTDSSSITVRQQLTGVGECLPVLLQSDSSRYVVTILEQLARLVSNKYWLVRCDLCHVVSHCVTSDAASYISASWSDSCLQLLTQLLSDDDSRVRTAAVTALVKICEEHTDSVSTTVQRVTQLLISSTSKHLTSGCLEFLSSMSKALPPDQHPECWAMHHSQPQSRGQSLLSRCVKMLTSSTQCQDLLTHSNLVTVSCQLFAGLASVNIRDSVHNYEGVTSLVANDDKLSELAEELLTHLLKLLSIHHHVLEDQIPSLPSTKPSLPSLPNSTLSPIKKKSSEPSTPVSPPAIEKSFSFKEEKKRGQFYGSQFYMKQYELVKASYSIYKSSLDPSSEEKLVFFTNNLLDSFSMLLDFSLGNDIGKLVEECLSYVRSCLGVAPSKTLTCVQSLLRCLFKCNQPYNESDTESGKKVAGSGTYFEKFISNPYSRMTVDYNLVVDGPLSLDSSGSSSVPRNKVVKRNVPRNTDRSSLASYIRMFEPIVIKALKLYTVTSDVSLQSEVLQLLITLVRLRVNYCLLDSDQIFIGFVTKQLESIQEGEINKAELLIPHIFEFLTLLSYERYHSKTVIDVPSILQLCEGLSTSKDSRELLVPALEIVAVDLFERSSSADTVAELETQREVVVNMMMKQMGCSRVWRVVTRILTLLETEEEEVGRRLSRQVVDVLIPLLCQHQVTLTTHTDLLDLKTLLRSLAPGSLRPCDKIISSLLSCHSDLAVLSEVLSWLGFTIATFITMFHLSPEEAILGRLQELGIMLGSGGSSLLDTSLEESLSLSEDQHTTPEFTLSVYFLHVVGSGVSKLHQLVFCPSYKDSHDTEFLSSLVSDLLLVHVYILQSGRCPRMSQSMVALARSGGHTGALHNIDLITDMVFQLTHSQPAICCQWLYILVLLDKCPPSVWAQCLGISKGPSNTRSHEQSSPAASLNMEMLRKSAISILANKLNNSSNSDGELLAWFLSSQVREIVSSCLEDANIREFVSIVHRQPAASGLFLESVSARIESMRGVKYHHNILSCLQHIHPGHSGRLIVLLFNKFLTHPALHLANKAASLVCCRLELLLSEKDSFVQAQLSSTDVSSLKECVSTKPSISRHTKLVGLLNRLAMTFYDLSPTTELSDNCRKFNPSSVSGVSIDKAWYLAQVKRSCCGQSPAKECAKLLANMSLSDIMLIMTSKDFKLKVLDECLVQGISMPHGRAPSIDSLDRLPGLLSDPDRSPTPGGVREGPPLYRAASQVLLQHIKNVVELLPLPFHVYRPEAWWDPSHAEARYSAKLDDFFSSCEGQSRLTQLLPSLTTLLTTYPRLPGRRPSLPPHCVLDMVRFAVLCLEMVKWTVASCRSDSSPGQVSIVNGCLEVAGLTLSNPHLSSALSMASNNTLAASASISLTDFILASCSPINLPDFPWPTLTEALQSPSPPGLLVAHSNVARLLLLLETNTSLSSDLDKCEPVIIGLARLSQFTFLSRAPPLAFSLGWEPQLRLEAGGQVSGNMSQELLQEVDILQQFIWRINTLGWTSKAQFEETWMCLLPVLNVAKDDLTNEEAAALGQSTSLVVAGLTSLLVNTLSLPVAGVPGARILHHPRDSPHPSLMGGSGRGQQLTTIQNIIHMRPESGAVGLPVDSSVNLERASMWSGDCDSLSGYSPVPVSGYGPGQVSVNYLKTCVAYHEESSEDRQSIASSVLPLFLILREENLAAAGLDTISCVHFITDLFSQWLGPAGGQSTSLPLTVLTSAVRCLVMISDIFTQDSQFCWMLDTLSDIYRHHPLEDELLCELLLLGLAKAVSVVGFIEPDLSDRLRKGLESGLRSGQLSARSAAVHSLLYLLQREECSELYQVAVEHLRSNLLGGVKDGNSDQHTLALWALMFFTLENCDDRDLVSEELTADLLATAVGTAGQQLVPRPVLTTILSGLERVVVSGVVRSPSPQLDLVVHLATDLMTDWPPSSVVPAIQLFLAAMYSSHTAVAAEHTRTLTDPEMLMSMMEQMSILFDCIRRSGPGQAELLTDILPGVLLDFFPASDIVNRVISEFISPGQPHPHLLAGVLRQIFQAQANSHDQYNMLTEWVLVSLPNFTRRAPLSHSIWCLSCFFLAASSNPWLQAMFPHLQYRSLDDTSISHDDRRLFCLAAADFYSGLTDQKQKTKFLNTFEEVSSPGSPYSELLSTLEHRKAL